MGDFAAAAAAVVYGGAMLVLLGVRSWQQRRATGSTGFRGFTGMTSGGAERAAGLCFMAAVILGLVSPVLAGLHLLPPSWRGEHWAAAGWVWAALVLAAAGLALAVVAQQTMGASWRIGVDPAERTVLVRHGVFALVRNPIFTAMIAVQVGTAVMAPTWLGAVGVVAMVVGCMAQTRLVEEPYLLRTHGATYARYAGRTGRFIPGVGRLDHRPVSGRPRSAGGQA